MSEHSSSESSAGLSEHIALLQRQVDVQKEELSSLQTQVQLLTNRLEKLEIERAGALFRWGVDGDFWHALNPWTLVANNLEKLQEKVEESQRRLGF